MGRITAICVSERKGTQKHYVEQAELRVDHGIVGDDHAGNWHRQVSLLNKEKIDDFRARGQAVLDALTAYAAGRPGWTAAPDNCEGVRYSLDKNHGDGWFLLRLSLHDPLLPLNIESDSPGGLRRIARELAPFLAEQTAVDAGALLEAAV